MARQKRSREDQTKSKRARTPEARENQVIGYAYDLAEEQILGGTASSQVLTHFLKLGTERERLERKKLETENALLEARREQIESQARVEELYAQALAAMQSYSGASPESVEEE